ncbi:helix-turn-helix transcriptional regulator (plasmid) [Nostoc sp. UHCC 0302]|uniref:helix-turn-helix domain-containing protein n=1 Tax=Nostoc sp. UHCC 0302 TaxID=3134896 RepID=UPI00311CA272
MTPPNPKKRWQSTLKEYAPAFRKRQNDLAVKAGIHLQSIGKIERGMTTKLNSKSQRGLAVALQVPPEYLDAVVRGVAVVTSDVIRFCSHCWTPGTAVEEIWLSPLLTSPVPNAIAGLIPGRFHYSLLNCY